MKSENISVIKIRDVLMVTMPADPEDETVSGLQSQTLEAMAQNEVRGLILDLSRVESLDSYFARTVTETARMVTLMGGETIIAGMRPPVAITATQLGLKLGALRTALNVDAALTMVGETKAGKRWQ